MFQTAGSTAPTALEQSFADICERHGLLNAGLAFHSGEGSFYSISLQWTDAEDRGCAHGHGQSIADALAEAMDSMLAKRGASIALADEALPIGEAA